jgi:hypothetical protein
MARPSFKATAVQRERVAVAAAGGMAHAEIALAIGVSRNTLEKHFRSELTEGAQQRRLDVLNAQYRAALEGNVAAQKAFLLGHATGKKVPSPRKSSVGKKTQAERAALTAEVGTEWEELLQKPV